MIYVYYILITINVKNMKNIGTVDRVMRSIVGLLLLWLGYSQLAGIWMWIAYIVGAIMILVGIFSFCPLYKLFNINTCKSCKNEKEEKEETSEMMGHHKHETDHEQHMEAHLEERHEETSQSQDTSSEQKTDTDENNQVNQ